jgi:uncharacterized protein (TIGR02246 family)
VTSAEKRELRDLVERYAQAVDRADADGAAELFTDDGELAVWLDPASDAPTGQHRGRAEIAAAIGTITRYVATHHAISSHSSQVESLGASGETLCTAHHVSETRGKRSDRVLYIRYLDHYARRGSDWLISRREVRVQWVSTLPVD